MQRFQRFLKNVAQGLTSRTLSRLPSDDDLRCDAAGTEIGAPISVPISGLPLFNPLLFCQCSGV